MSKPEIQLTLAQARRAAFQAQGLGRHDHDLLSILDRTGFIRTLGGSDVYLAARARRRDIGREDLDQAMAEGRLYVGPTVRGCIYLMTRRHVFPSLTLAKLQSHKRMAREHEKVEFTVDELNRVSEAICSALASGPLTTQQLRKKLPEGTVRSFGDLGKKIGLSSSLPPTLRCLEFDGLIERQLEGGRLDTERYLWALTGSSEAAGTSHPAPEEIHQHMAEVFLRAAGFADADSFAAWSGLGKRDARAALAALDTVSLAVAGVDASFLALKDQAGKLQDAAQGPTAPPSFLPFEDNLLAFRQGPAFFVAPEFHHIQVPVWGRGKGSTLGDVRHGSQRPIVALDRIVGFWELDPESQTVVTGLFDPAGKEVADEIEVEARRVQEFLVGQIGHGRSLSIDTEKNMSKRCDHIRALSKT